MHVGDGMIEVTLDFELQLSLLQLLQTGGRARVDPGVIRLQAAGDQRAIGLLGKPTTQSQSEPPRPRAHLEQLDQTAHTHEYQSLHMFRWVIHWVNWEKVDKYEFESLRIKTATETLSSI